MKKPIETASDFASEVRLNGAQIAYRALVAILEDPKAPAHAKAQAASSILRAGGHFAAKGDDPGEAEPSQMTSEELQRSIERLRLEIGARPTRARDITPVRAPKPRQGSGVFE